MSNINVGVIGSMMFNAQEVVECLEELIDERINVFVYSNDSKGESIYTNKVMYTVEELNENVFDRLKYAIFCGDNKTSEKYVPIAIEKRCIVIDNSSNFRLNEDIPLISVGSNDEDVYKHKGVILTPNASVIQLSRSLKIIDELYNVKKVVVSTYQSVSMVGKKAIEEYSINQYIHLPEYNAFPYMHSKFHYSIKDNIIPQTSEFDLDSGFSKEEISLAEEIKKILGNHIELTATCVTVPTLRGLAQSVYVETDNEVDVALIKNKFMNDEYVQLKDDLENQIYPLVKDCYYCKKSIVGRIRKDMFNSKGIHLYIVGDNLCFGTYYNAVMILKLLIERGDDVA